MTEEMGKIEAFQKSIMRRIRRVDYKNTPTPPKYDEAEAQYKRLRDFLSQVDALLASLSNYEHGSSLYKNIKMGMQYLNDKTSLGLYKTMDMYESASAVGAYASETQGTTPVAQAFQSAFEKMSECKKRLNEGLKPVQGTIKDIRSEIKKIDKIRKDAKNLRYDAEMLSKNKNDSPGEFNSKKEEYEKKAKDALGKMTSFNKDTHADRILKKIYEEHRSFLQESVSLFKDLK